MVGISAANGGKFRFSGSSRAIQHFLTKHNFDQANSAVEHRTTAALLLISSSFATFATARQRNKRTERFLLETPHPGTLMPNDPPPPPAGHAESAGSSTASPVPLAAATAGATPTQGRNAPARGQLVPLSTKREESSIPKGGAGGTWLYPSPQMFFNALLRKGKSI